MPDDKIIKLGTDDDLQIKYTNSGDVSSILDTSTGLTVGSADVQITDDAGTVKFFKANTTNSIVYHNDTARITTSATGININGTIDAVTDITSSGNVVGNGTAHQLGSSASGKLGVGRAAATYNLEVEGSIFATGSSLILGDSGTQKTIIQKRVASSTLHFTDNTGTDQAVLDGNGQFGIGKTPAKKLDVSGDGWFDGDITINTTNPANQTGGKITAREIILTDPQTGSTATLNSSTGSGVSMAKVYFHSFN